MSLSLSEKNQLAESLLQYGSRQGTDEMSIAIGSSREFSVEVRNQNIEHLEEAGSSSISMKVICEDKTATASSSDLNIDSLKSILKRAVERAAHSTPDPFSALPDCQPIPCNIDDLNLVDQQIDSLSAQSKIDYAMQTEALCLKDKRIRLSHGASFSSYTGSTFLMNSKGFQGDYDKTMVSCGVHLQVGDQNNLLDEGWYDSAVHFSELQSPEVIAEKALHRAARMIDARKIKTQNVPVILEPSMTASLMGFIVQCISGSKIYMKQSLFTDRLGEIIGNEHVNIVDQALIPAATGTRPFDREGVPTGETLLFEKGRLNSYLLDTYSARKLKLQSTGHASGSTNLRWQPGLDSLEAMIQSIDQGLLLTGFLGFGLNPATGDLSRGACGLWIDQGEIAFPVAEMTVSGNLADMLQQIEMIGNDPDLRRSVSGPSLKINGMTVGGI